ncbi:hypothetical protein [Thiomonas bhubaneswarensis]|uniref:hypothetical protein n=1 Tax=Thiomonas bhubaneswarensis TaxID=339866 RepID=UPI000AF1914B|nr:hypothetical protein [Thiomonas bhubaneswarensis]
MTFDHIATDLGIEAGNPRHAPFSQHDGLGKAHQLSSEKLNAMIEESNETLAA